MFSVFTIRNLRKLSTGNLCTNNTLNYRPYDYSFILCLVGIIKAKVLDPVSIDGLTADDVPELTENVRQKMLKVFHENDQSVSNNDTVSTEDKKIK